jgi:hypothetical protein
MTRIGAIAAALCAAAGMAATGWAQEGHPLSGTWHGEWTAGGKKTPVLLLLKWESRMITGVINPGTESIHLKVATLTPGAWEVHLEAETRDAGGKVTPIVIDGKIEDIGAYNRRIVGTWTQGSQKGEFRARRD